MTVSARWLWLVRCLTWVGVFIEVRPKPVLPRPPGHISPQWVYPPEPLIQLDTIADVGRVGALFTGRVPMGRA